MFLIDMSVGRIYCKKIFLIGAKLWPAGGVTDTQTDGRSDRQTNGTDQYTLRRCPSGFSQSNEPQLLFPTFNDRIHIILQ